MLLKKEMVRVEFLEDGQAQVAIHKDLVHLLNNDKIKKSVGDPDYYMADFALNGTYRSPTNDPCDPRPGTGINITIVPPEDDLPDGGNEDGGGD